MRSQPVSVFFLAAFVHSHYADRNVSRLCGCAPQPVWRCALSAALRLMLVCMALVIWCAISCAHPCENPGTACRRTAEPTSVPLVRNHTDSACCPTLTVDHFLIPDTYAACSNRPRQIATFS
ncbi:MAG: hypothetical protein OXC07_05925 [Kistimonas sp.]|nr:hypothetical protein [Kistimonas sp.]